MGGRSERLDCNVVRLCCFCVLSRVFFSSGAALGLGKIGGKTKPPFLSCFSFSRLWGYLIVVSCILCLPILCKCFSYLSRAFVLSPCLFSSIYQQPACWGGGSPRSPPMEVDHPVYVNVSGNFACLLLDDDEPQNVSV